MELTHWKKLNNPDYLGAYAFQPGEEIIATIGSVGRETITNADGKKEECTVAHFTAPAGIKPMILNPTNCKTIEKVAGTPYIEQWQGVMIQLYVTQVKAFGDVVAYSLLLFVPVSSRYVFTCTKVDSLSVSGD